MPDLLLRDSEAASAATTSMGIDTATSPASRQIRDQAAVNAAVGGMPAWIVGNDFVEQGTSPAGGAFDEVLSWFGGKHGKRNRRR